MTFTGNARGPIAPLQVRSELRSRGRGLASARGEGVAGGAAQRYHLAQGRGLSVVLLVMKAGDRLEEHSAPGPIALIVREGRIRFTADGRGRRGRNGDDAHVRRREHAIAWRP